MMFIGLTGLIASGKTTIAKLLHEKGAEVVSADEIARNIVNRGQPAYQQILKSFGEDILQLDLEIDRKLLGERIFSHETSRLKLNAIVHPYVHQQASEQFVRIKKRNSKAVIVYDIPLLMEVKDSYEFDWIVVAQCPEEVCIERMYKRGLSAQDAQMRIASQASEQARFNVADIVIDTAKSLQYTQDQVDRLWDKIFRKGAKK